MNSLCRFGKNGIGEGQETYKSQIVFVADAILFLLRDVADRHRDDAKAARTKILICLRQHRAVLWRCRYRGVTVVQRCNQRQEAFRRSFADENPMIVIADDNREAPPLKIEGY